MQFAHSTELVLITTVAAVVNGALGYGFSSITVPLALLFLTNRVLNPALVPIEVALNAYVLWVNRRGLAAVRARLMPVAIGLAPGVVVGTLIVAQVRPEWLKLGTFALLLPLILVQAAGYRRPIRDERSFGYGFGAGVGVLYSVTTISGPPLAVFLNNQGLAKQEFRAGLGFIRLAESTFTAAAYAYAGLLLARELRAPAIDSAGPAGRRAARRVADPPDRCGDVPPAVYELRRVGRRVRPLDAAARAPHRRGSRRVPCHGDGDRDRRAASLSVLLWTSAAGDLGIPCAGDQVMHMRLLDRPPAVAPGLDHLRALEAESIHILREVVAEFERPVMLYSIGKDSSVLLRLAQKAFHPGPIPFPLLHVDTTYKFREMIEFRDWYAAEVGARLIVHTNREAIADGAQPFAVGTQRCCGLLKTRALARCAGRGWLRRGVRRRAA